MDEWAKLVSQGMFEAMLEMAADPVPVAEAMPEMAADPVPVVAADPDLSVQTW